MGVTGGNIHTILLQEENIINVPPTIGFEQWFDMSDWKKKKAEGDQAYNEWFKAKMDDVIRRLRDPERVEKYGQITELRKKLNVQYAVGRQQKLLNEHYTGRKWLGEKIDAWLEDPNAPRRCLVTGVPGVGKSAFAVHYAHYNPKTAAALFFSADMPNYNDPCVVIQTLAYLLACRLSAYRKSLLWELNQEDRTTLAKLTEKELLDKLITRPLSQAINGNHPAMCIILDGLEECGDPQKNTLAKTIARYADSLPWWLHILIVARDVPAVKNYTKNALRIEMHGEDKDNLEDIRAYYREALEEKFGNDPAWPETLEQITARSQGIFLYAKMLTSLLLDKGTLDVGGDYPEGLSEVFTLWFDWFFPDGEDYARRWRLPIGCVLGSPDPIPAQTLRRVFDWSENELADFEARLSILLRKGKNVFGDETLVFDHDFVKEWLSSGAGENFYFSSPEDGRKKMAHALYAVFEEDAEELTYWEAVNLLDLPLTKKQREKIGEESDYLFQIEKAAYYCDSWGKETAAKEIYEKGIETAQNSHKNKNWGKSFFIHLIDLNIRMGYSTKINTMLKNSISCDEAKIAPGEKESVYNIIMLTRKYLLEGDICKSNGDYEDAFNWYGKGLVNMQDALRVIDSDFVYGHYCLCMERLGSIQEVYEQYEEAARTYITAAMVRLDLWKRDKCSDNTSTLVVGVLGAIRSLSMCQEEDFTKDYINIFNGIIFQVEKAIRIVSQVFLVSFRHMLQLHQRIVLHRLQAAVTRHTTAVVVDLDNILRYANINFLSNQIVRNRVFVPTIRDAVIVGNLSHRPDGRLKRNCWQRQHIRLFFFKIGTTPTACTHSEFAGVELFQLFCGCFLCFLYREELPITKSCNNPSLCIIHRCLRGAFVLWLTNASWNNGSSIVLCQLLVAAVHYHIIPGIGIRRSFAVVRNQKSRCSAKVVKRMNVAV